MKLNNKELTLLEEIVRRDLDELLEYDKTQEEMGFLDHILDDKELEEELETCRSLYSKIQDLHLDQLPTKYPWKVA
jgi:hypothetical protein